MKQEKREDTTGRPIMAEKKKRPAVDKSAVFPVATNVYPVQTKHIPVFRYDVTMNVHYPRADGTFAERCITKKDEFRGGDASMQERHSMCRDVFRKLRAEDKMVKKQRHVYYDLQSILFSLDPLGIGKDTAYTTILKADKLDKNYFGRANNVEVIIKEVKEGDIQLMLDDHTGANRDLSLEDRALLQFIDIATSQHAYFNEQIHVPFNANRTYLVDPTKHGFRAQDLAEFPDNGAYLGIGCQKAANWVEGPNKVKCLSLVLDTKKTAFHGGEQVLQKFKRLVRDYRDLRNGDFDKVRRIISGIEVMTTHRQNNRLYRVKTVVNMSARQKKVETEEYGEVTIEQYFQKKYGIKLKEPTIPLLETPRGELLPMELCVVADSQRVRTEQQTSVQVQEMIKKCAVPPAKHIDQIGQMFKAMSLEKSACLQDAQINVHTQPVTVQDARVLPLPQLVYARQDQQVRVDQTGQWKMQGRFVKPSGCKKWVAYAFLGPRDRLLINEFKQFLDKFAQEAQKCGMGIPNRAYREPEIKSASDNLKVLEDMVSGAKRDGCDFFVIVHGDTDDTTHAYIKLLEQRYEIVTQEFRVSTVNKVVQRNQWMTMQNIVFKSNCKMGGLNYTLFPSNQIAKKIMGADTLFIGVAINYPSGAKGSVPATNQSESEQKQFREEPPTVVGYAANVGRCDEFEFVGDFVFQESRGEVFVKSMGKIVKQVLALHKRVRKAPPKRVVIYRNECSDGRLPIVLMQEVPHIKSIFAQAGCKSAALTYIAVSKMQGIRLFKTKIDAEARAPEQNIPVGLVVDSTIVHPEYTEFFLNSHRALQGTARTPRYVVAVDESNFPLTQLEEMTYQLCYGHQIVNMPTSTPSPVYIANRYAERGRKVINSRMKEDRTAVFTVDCDTLTSQLAYYEKEDLKQRRINA